MRIPLTFALAALFLVLCPPARAGDLSWLAGRWQGSDLRGRWASDLTGDEGGVVLGTYKQWDPAGKLTFVELQEIDTRQRPITLLLVANGGEPYRMQAVKLVPGRIEFTGERPFPKRAIFARRGDGYTLTLIGALKGAQFEEEFPMRRAP